MLGIKHRGCLIPFLLLLLHNESSATTDINVGEKNQHLPRVALPIEYKIKLILYMPDDNFTFHGESTILIKVLEKTSNVTLHSNDLLIDENFTSLVDANGVTHTVKRHSYADATNFFVIEFDRPISVGNYTLSLKYSGNTPVGINYYSYVKENGEKKLYIFSNFYPKYARTVFPCWDDNEIKATFELSMKHDPNVHAISNMPSRSEFRDDDGKVWINFGMTPPIPAYRLDFIVSDFRCLRSANLKFGFCGRKEFLPHLKQPLEFTERAMAVLEKYIGSKYMWPMLNQFALPTAYQKPWKPLIYGESLFNESDPLLAMETGDVEIAGNLTKHLLRDSVTLSSWNCSWIIEGLSFFLGYRIVDELHPDWRQMDIFAILKVQYAGFTSDSQDWHDPLSAYNRLSLPQILIRSGAIFHMLSNVLTEDTFNSGIQKFIKKAEYRPVTSDDLWNAMQSAYDENKEESNAILPIREIMKSWSNQIGYPIVNVTRDYETGRVTITQKGVVKGRESNRYWIPINFATKSNPNFGKTTPTHWLKPEDERLIIDGIGKDDWIIVNIQLSAYYIVDYDETNWKLIAEYMNSENYRNIHVINRASLINDLFYGVNPFQNVVNRRQNFTTYLDLVSYLIREDDYLPWFAAIRGIGLLRTITYGYEIDELIKKFFLVLADKVIQKIDFEDRDFDVPKYKIISNKNNNKTEIVVPTIKNHETFYKNEDFFTIRYRSAIKYLGCSLGHPSCLESDTDHLRAQKKYPDEVIPLLYYVHDKDCDEVVAESTEELLKEMLKNNMNEQYLNHLMCKSDTKALKDFVEKSFAGEFKPSVEQISTALSYLIKKSNNTINNTVDYVIQNFDAICNTFERIEDVVNRRYEATLLLRNCFDMAYTPEQTKKGDEFTYSI